MTEKLGAAVLELRTDQKGYDEGMKRAHTSAKELDKTFGGLKQASGKLFDALKGVAAAYLSIQGVKKLVGFVDEATNAFEAQDNALTRLAVAVRENPALNGDSFRRLAALGGELQKVTIFGDEQVQQALSFAAAAGLTESQIKRIGVVAADIASSGLMDYSTAVAQLSRTYTGLAGTLGRIIPGMNDLTQEQLKQGAAIEMVAARYAGMAGAMADSVSGVHTRTKNLAGDIMETIGGVFGQLRRKMELQLIPVLEGLNEWFTANGPKIYAIFANLPEVLRIVGETGINIVKKMFSLETLGSLLANLAEGIVRAISVAFKEIFLGWRTLIAGFTDIAREFGDNFWRYFLQGYLNAITTLPRKGLGLLGNLLGIEGMANMEQTLKVNLVGEGVGKAINDRVMAQIGGFAGSVGQGVWGALKELGGAAVDAAKTLEPILSEAGRKLAPIIEKGAVEFTKYNSRVEDLANSTVDATAALHSFAFPEPSLFEQSKAGYPQMMLDQMFANIGAGGGGGAKGGITGVASQGLLAFEGALTDATIGMSGFAGQVAQSVMQLGPWGALLELSKPILQGWLDVIGPILENALKPLFGALVILGQYLAIFLVPWLTAIAPLLDMFGQLIALLVPVIDAVSRPFRFLADFMGWVIAKIRYGFDQFLAWLDSIIPGNQGWASGVPNPGAFVSYAFDNPLATASWADITGAGADYFAGMGGAGGEMGAAATYRQERPITVSIDVHDNTIAGDGSFRDLALAIKNELVSVDALGLA